MGIEWSLYLMVVFFTYSKHLTLRRRLVDTGLVLQVARQCIIVLLVLQDCQIGFMLSSSKTILGNGNSSMAPDSKYKTFYDHGPVCEWKVDPAWAYCHHARAVKCSKTRPDSSSGHAQRIAVRAIGNYAMATMEPWRSAF